MKKTDTVVFIVIILVVIGIVYYFRDRQVLLDYNLPTNQQTNIASMKITSPAFKNGEAVPSKYTCDGVNVNPPLEIKEVPDQTQSLVLVVEDPDAPVGTWTHWIVWNIDPATTSITENSVPQGAVVGQSSFGQNVYGGPCPPSGTHRYYFKLYALPEKLNLSSFSDVKTLTQAISGKTIAEAELMGTYTK